jgi:hypothetical protein
MLGARSSAASRSGLQLKATLPSHARARDSVSTLHGLHAEVSSPRAVVIFGVVAVPYAHI